MFKINLDHIQIRFQLFFRNFIKYTRNKPMFPLNNNNQILENYGIFGQNIKINYLRTKSNS